MDHDFGPKRNLFGGLGPLERNYIGPTYLQGVEYSHGWNPALPPRTDNSEPYAVRTWVTRVGTSSYTLASQICDGETVLSSAEAVLVAFDTATQRSRPLSDEERTLLEGALVPA